MRPLILAILLFLASFSPAAFAQDDAAEAFSQGVALFEQNKCAEALPLLEKAVNVTGSPNARIYVARCLLELGQVAEAYEQMKTTVADATTRAETDKRYEPTRDSGAAELAILEQKIGKVVIAIENPPPGLSIELAGRNIPATRIGEAIAVAPGAVTLKVRAPGKRPIVREVSVVAGKMETIPLTLFDEGTAPPQPPGPAPAPPAPKHEGTQMVGGELRIVGFILGGLGLVGVGIGAGLAVKADSDFSDIDEECGGNTCPTPFQDRVDDGRSLELGGNIALFAGAGLAAAGLLMIVFGGPDEVPVEAAVAPVVGGGTLHIGGRF